MDENNKKEFAVQVAKIFIADNWGIFQLFCKARNEDPDEIYQELDMDAEN